MSSPTQATCHHLKLKKVVLPGGPGYKCEACGEDFCVPDPMVIRVIESSEIEHGDGKSNG